MSGATPDQHLTEELEQLRREVVELKQHQAKLEQKLQNAAQAAIAPNGQLDAHPNYSTALATSMEAEARLKSLETRLQQSNQMLRQVTDSIPLAIFWKDCAGIYRGCNQFGAGEAKIEAAAIAGKTDADLSFSRKQVELFNELDRQVLATDTPLCHAVHTLIQPNGRQIWLDITKAPLYDHAGSAIGILTAYEEITERLLAQSALQQQWEFLHRLVDSFPNLILVQNWNGQVLLANQATADFFGTQIDQLLGEGAKRFFAAEIWERFSDENQEVILSEEDLLIPAVQWVDAQGQTRWMQWIKRVLPLPGSEELGVLAIATDITGQKQAQTEITELNEQLKAEGERYRNIYENSVVGIFQTTPAGNYLSANPALAQIYGYASATELIANLSDISNQLYVKRDRRAEFTRLIETHSEIKGFESQVYCRDGRVIWISESARAVRYQSGTTLYYEGTVEDITARKQAEALLATANEEITRLNEQLKAENLRMGAELDITRRLQQMILPRAAELQQITDLDIAGFMEPATEVGGDYYDVLQHNGKISIGIGDVTGHGLESGMVMLMAQTAIRTMLAMNETDPVKLLSVLNQVIYTNTHRMQSDKSMTLALLQYEAGVIRLCGQHEELIVVQADGQIKLVDTLDLGFPLGMELDISPFISQVELRLQPGEVAVLYTDGITEAVNPQNELYGQQRLYQVLRQSQPYTAKEIQQAVITDVKRHIGTQKVFDDITLVVLKQRS